MIYGLTFEDYIINELKEEEYSNKEYEFDDYSMNSSDIDYTTQY